MPTCKKCGNVVSALTVNADGICENCIDTFEQKREEVTSVIAPNQDGVPHSKATWYLKIFSWINLIFAIIASLIILSTMSTVEVTTYLGHTKEVFNAFGVALGIGIFFEGIFISLIGLTLSYVADNISKH